MNGELKRPGNVAVLDSLRAFAALSVCLYHFVCTTTGYIHTQWLLDLFSFGKYGVQLFFVISGFVIPYAMDRGGYQFKSFFSFFLKRLARLEPPYLVSLALATAVLLARERILGPSDQLQPVTATRLALHIGYLIPFFEQYKWINQVYWTLAIEFQYYLMIALLYLPLVRSGLLLRIAVYILLVFLSTTTSSAFLPYWLPVFLLGIVLFLERSDRISLAEFYIVSVLLLIYIFIFYDLGDGLFCLFGLLVIKWYSGHDSSIGSWLGRMSYSIYLIHPVIGATFINVLSHHFNSPAGKFMVICGGLLVTLAGSLAMYYAVERPSKKLSALLKY